MWLGMLLILMIGSHDSFAEGTELKLYRPFEEGKVWRKEKRRGQCLQQSQRIKREDAWRCMVDDHIYDPCFIKPYSAQQEAICPTSPWFNESIQINLASPVDNSQHTTLDMSETYPWALELRTGETCQAVDAGEHYEGLQVHYRCNNQTLLIGHVQRCKATWSILQRTAQGVSTAWIAKAWF